MTRDIDNYNGGNGNFPKITSQLLFQLGKQLQSYEEDNKLLETKNKELETKNKELKEENEELKEYGLNYTNIRKDTYPSELLSTDSLRIKINENRIVNGLKGKVTKRDINERAVELGMLIMNGGDIISVTEEYIGKVIKHSNTIAYFNNDCYKKIVDSFSPNYRVNK